MKMRRGEWLAYSLSYSLLFLVLVSYAYSFGISTPYLQNDTLKLEPGQQYTYTIIVQNNEDLSFNVDLNYSSDGDIAKLLPADTFINAKSYNNKFSFQITIPDKAKPGDIYWLSFSARPLLNQSGEVPMVVEIKRGITIDIVDKNGQGYKKTWLDNQPWLKNAIQSITLLFDSSKIYIAAIVLILLLYFILFRVWKIANKISINISFKNDAPKKIAFISDAKNISDLKAIISRMPEEQIEVPEIRQLIAEKISQFDNHLSQKMMHAGDKKNILKYLEES